MANDYDLGSGSINVNAKRYVFRMDWNRDKGTKTEMMSGFIQQTNTNTDTGKVVSYETYLVSLTDAALNSFRGHNNFLSDIKDCLNQCVVEFKASGSILDPVTGSITQLDVGS